MGVADHIPYLTEGVADHIPYTYVLSSKEGQLMEVIQVRWSTNSSLEANFLCLCGSNFRTFSEL